MIRRIHGDDLQWADASTLDLLDHVVARPVSARLLVVGAYRHDEIDGDRRARLARIGSHTDHVHLEGLSVEAVEALVARICDPRTAGAHAGELQRRTGGHPLFVSELARLPEFGAGGPLPTVVTGAVARRLELLPAESRAVLDAASVLGNRLLPDVLAAAATDGSSPADIVSVLGPAVDAGLVKTSSSDGFWFTHDLFRETLYRALDATHRSRLHGRIGDALEVRRRRGGQVDPGDLAYHFARAVPTWEADQAFHWAREAALDERRRLAFTEAAGQLRRARDAALDAGRSIAPGILISVLILEADNEARSGDPDSARRLLRDAAAAAADAVQVADVALAVQRLGAKFATRRNETIAQLDAARQAIAGDRPRACRPGRRRPWPGSSNTRWPRTGPTRDVSANERWRSAVNRTTTRP